MSAGGATSDRAELSAALGRLATTPVLLVALDFDGTLAPEVDDPLAARAVPEAVTAIRRLADLDATRVALVSGRDLVSLGTVAEVDEDVLLVGSHGIELRVDGHESSLTDAELALRAELARVLEDAARGRAGVHVEGKPAGLALHTRTADEATTEAVVRDALAGVAGLSGVTERRGKNVVEFAVRPTGKDDGVRRLRELTGATGVLFAGDDVTDEDGFRALGPGDLGLKVGGGETLASLRVDDAAAVAELLHELADLRAHLGHA